MAASKKAKKKRTKNHIELPYDKDPIQIVQEIDESVRQVEREGNMATAIMGNMLRHMADYLILLRMCSETELLQFGKEYEGFFKYTGLVSSLAMATDIRSFRKHLDTLTE